MRSVVFGCGALLALLGEGRAGEGWVSLFDGKTLGGWVQRYGTAQYRVEEGAIVGRTSEGSANSFLTTMQEFGDFELEFEVRVDDELNSGVQVRSGTKERSTGEGPDDRAGRVRPAGRDRGEPGPCRLPLRRGDGTRLADAGGAS